MELKVVGYELMCDESADIHLSVGLPCYNARDIAWLALEGLCRQEGIAFKWELIICEEPHGLAIGRNFAVQYLDRLERAGCARVVYVEMSHKVVLPTKWITIGQYISPSSQVFVMQAADCYPSAERLTITYRRMYGKGVDWLDFTCGYFYSFVHDKLILYSHNGKTNLHMAFSSRHFDKLRYIDKNKSIDSWLFKSILSGNESFKREKETGLYASVDTDGFNCISRSRSKFYLRTAPPFKQTKFTIEQIGLPPDVVQRIKNQCQMLRK